MEVAPRYMNCLYTVYKVHTVYNIHTVYTVYIVYTETGYLPLESRYVKHVGGHLYSCLGYIWHVFRVVRRTTTPTTMEIR